MYEMEGPCLALPRQDSRLPGFVGAARRQSVPDTRAKDRFPGSLRPSRYLDTSLIFSLAKG